jgi:hypothetical protein
MDDEWDDTLSALLRAVERTAKAVGDGATPDDATVIDTLVTAYTRLSACRSTQEPPSQGTPVRQGSGKTGVKEFVKEMKEGKEQDKMKESEAGFTSAPPGSPPPPTATAESSASHFIRPEHRPDVGFRP